MEQAFAEMPLAIFTTLAPVSAGAFIALAIAFFTTSFDNDQLKKIDKLTFIPLIGVVVGLLASVIHLTAPLNGIYIFSGLGRSPLSNEVTVGIIFGIVAIVYCILAVTGKLSFGARKVFAGIVALVAIVFALFTGMAYMMETIVSWNTPLIPFQILGFSLLGGALFGSFVLALAGSLESACKGSFKTAILALAIIGAVVAIVAVAAHFALVSGITTALVSGGALTSELVAYLVVFIVLALIALVCQWIAVTKKPTVGITVLGTIVALVAVFVARLIFYAMQISVGL